MKKHEIVCKALRAAQDGNAPHKTAIQWAKDLDTSRTYMYRCAAKIGLEFFFQRRDSLPTATSAVQHRTTKYGTNPNAHIPVSILRNSGMDKATRLKFIVDAGKIIVEPIVESKP